ncbi:lipocalin family protein [Snuella sedimenti]|uniref:Lipocalin family protein n=1 Tax=Snuella sedimenti TaxID=2798802 RepID=A0A8J7LNN4_9FLAO|nr:lipocalin family protein [Snuella sedimenti]MBJ6368904.1 lipocalin family protein [Snuella sedimenti]
MTKKRLNLFILVMACVSVLTLGSCSSDDDNNNNAQDLLGTWNLAALTYDGETVSSFSGTSITTDFSGEGQNIDATVFFGDNPNAVNSQGTYDIALTYSVAGQESSQVISISEYQSEGTWSLKGNILTLVGEMLSFSSPSDLDLVDPGDSSIDYVIEELNATTMRLSATKEQSFTQSGATITSTVNVLVLFTR